MCKKAARVSTRTGQFGKLAPLDEQHVGHVPRKPGCYLIYLDGEVFYVGVSRNDIRGRLRRHLAGRGNRVIGGLSQATKRRLQFEYYDLCEEELATSSRAELENFEFFLMAMFEGMERPPANLRWDGWKLPQERRGRSKKLVRRMR